MLYVVYGFFCSKVTELSNGGAELLESERSAKPIIFSILPFIEKAYSSLM